MENLDLTTAPDGGDMSIEGDDETPPADLDSADTPSEGDMSLVGEGLAPPADLDSADVPDERATEDGRPYEVGDSFDETGNETGNETAPENDDPLDVDISLASISEPSEPNTDPERLAKFLNPTAITAITDETYIPITSVEDLLKIGDTNHENYTLGSRYYLTQDIDLTDVDWLPIGTSALPFTGTFDGQGYAIKNLALTETRIAGYDNSSNPHSAGLFGFVGSGATIKNVGLENTAININRAESGIYVTVGALVGFAYIANASTAGILIENCYNEGDVAATASSSFYLDVGGILGGNVVFNFNGNGPTHGVAVKYCRNAGSVAATNTNTLGATFVGGVCGGIERRSSIENCQNAATVFGTSTDQRSSSAAGICARFLYAVAGPSIVAYCENTGAITAGAEAALPSSAAAGGIIGPSGGNVTVRACTNGGAVSATASGGSTAAGIYIGGPSEPTDISACLNTGAVTATSSTSNT
ncbi:MAG: hypothetical protein LBI54_05415, partial [Lachnospiraceae bacterium]|nr:hypothetical protein [Lachnospiraceae bacterium]